MMRDIGGAGGGLRPTFVAEDAADFVDAIEAADDKPLQVQLGGDAEREGHVERPVVSAERLGFRAPGLRF